MYTLYAVWFGSMRQSQRLHVLKSHEILISLVFQRHLHSFTRIENVYRDAVEHLQWQLRHKTLFSAQPQQQQQRPPPTPPSTRNFISTMCCDAKIQQRCK